MTPHTKQPALKRRFGMMIAMLLTGLAPSPSIATTFRVTNTSDGPHPGPPGSLRAAVHAANTAVGFDTIEFDSSFLNELRTITLTGSSLTITGNVTITGPGADKLTISANNASRVFEVDPGLTVSIAGLSMADGEAGVNSGGGIFSLGWLTLDRCAIRNCHATVGGGIASINGTLVMNNTELSGNESTYGGGLTVLSTNGSSTAALTNVTVSHNSASHSQTAGGINVYATAGLAFVSLVNCTVAFNSNPGSAGGLYVGGFPSGSSQVTLKNTILSDNTDLQMKQEMAGTVVSNGSNLISDSSMPLPLSTDRINTPAMLRPLAFNGGPTRTHSLLWGSPAIDSGSNTAPPATDQRGRPRMVAAACGEAARVDRGAYEMQKFVVTSTADAGPGSLRWAIEDNNLDGGGVICVETLGVIWQAGGALEPLRDVTILGPAPGAIILDGMADDRLLNVPAGVHVVACDLVLSNGRRPVDAGGAISVEGGSLDMRRCSIINSYAHQAGGILNSNGTLRMSACEISGNTANILGGGIMSISQGVDTHTEIIDSTFSANSCLSSDGAGGGILATSTAASQYLRVENSTITANSIGAGPAPGGLTLYQAGGAGVTVEMGNCIIAGNAGPQIGTIGSVAFQSLGFNICSDNNPHFSAIGDRVLTDPLLGPLTFNGGHTRTHAIGPGSPALDAGRDSGLSTTDQCGGDRVRGCGIDIGAFEFQSGEPGSGDFDGNGTGLSDTAFFVETLLNPDAAQQCIADLNGDQFVDGLDIQEFVYAVFGI